MMRATIYTGGDGGRSLTFYAAILAHESIAYDIKSDLPRVARATRGMFNPNGCCVVELQGEVFDSPYQLVDWIRERGLVLL